MTYLTWECVKPRYLKQSWSHFSASCLWFLMEDVTVWLLQPCCPQVYRQSPDCHQPDTEGESAEVLQGEQLLLMQWWCLSTHWNRINKVFLHLGEQEPHYCCWNVAHMLNKWCIIIVNVVSRLCCVPFLLNFPADLNTRVHRKIWNQQNEDMLFKNNPCSSNF